MRLEKQKEEELARRKGLTGRTFIQAGFFIVLSIAAYFLSGVLLDPEGGLVTAARIRGVLPFLRQLPDWGPPDLWPRLVLTIGIVLVMQVLFSFGFILSSGSAWKKVGEGTLDSRNPDPFDDYR
jgi:hypothetical protein